MTAHRLIRIADIRFDPLTGRVDGVAIRRNRSGRVLRQHLSIPAHPLWTHADAVRALTARSQA
ncbi:hypothetical protein [Jannaschia rubra]|uniref:Uncharacterized protein n=1 Tax=Jannaschia rubra TaxID=282197 RepID=A0A0M6XSH4_9RHOB|nr:hypothetical protein [Jannaschia rubra]CTQ33612.1 hypothetical protein JAN5088_02395 [Jannaschia rubra]SFG04911.1 hypothetical protein SAMN04488517_102441 [Jannaschia rubra]